MPKATTYSDPRQVEETAVMQRLAEVTQAFNQIRDALTVVEEELRDPLAVLAWTEDHPVGHIMMQMGRQPKNNSILYLILSRAGVDTRARIATGTRERNITPQQLPEHLQELPQDVLELAEAAKKVLEARKEQQADAS